MEAMYKHLMIKKKLSSVTSANNYQTLQPPQRESSDRSLNKRNPKQIRVSVGIMGLGVSGRHLLDKNFSLKPPQKQESSQSID